MKKIKQAVAAVQEITSKERMRRKRTKKRRNSNDFITNGTKFLH
jgi:hypothetical protein